MIKRKASKVDIRRFPLRVIPSVWLFIIGFCLMILGFGIPGLDILGWVGLFIVMVYIAAGIAWIIIGMSEI